MTHHIHWPTFNVDNRLFVAKQQMNQTTDMKRTLQQMLLPLAAAWCRQMYLDHQIAHP